MSVVLGMVMAAAVSSQPVVLDDPEWKDMPSRDQVEAVYPKGGGEGEVRLRCGADADGRLHDCTVITESPRGRGFAEAALKLAPLYRLAPPYKPPKTAREAVFNVRFEEVSNSFALPAKTAVITNPDWARRPNGDEFSRFYPNVDNSGEAHIRCDVRADGRLAGCLVLSESPPGQGFGEATLKIASFFQMKPRLIDGRPVGGAVVETTIRWLAPASGPRRSVEASPTQEQVEAVWPEKAPLHAAQVLLSCRITPDGQAKGCAVSREDPPGVGFGEAALKLAKLYRFSRASQATDVFFTVPLPLRGPNQAGTAQFGPLTAMSNAPWAAAPSSAQVAAAWPTAARADLDAGHARLACAFTPEGGLTQCTVASEDVEGQGFGRAALSLAPLFRIEPGATDKSHLAQARIALSFTFANPARGPAHPDRLQKPNWLSFLEPDQLVALYPEAASKAGVKTGRAALDCTVKAGGALDPCKVGSETPGGLGFGEAALKGAKAFAVNPWTDDGRPVDGSSLHIVFAFDDTPQAPAPGAQAAAKP